MIFLYPWLIQINSKAWTNSLSLFLHLHTGFHNIYHIGLEQETRLAQIGIKLVGTEFCPQKSNALICSFPISPVRTKKLNGYLLQSSNKIMESSTVYLKYSGAITSIIITCVLKGNGILQTILSISWASLVAVYLGKGSEQIFNNEQEITG